MVAALGLQMPWPINYFLQNQNELSKKIEFNLVGSGYLKEQYMSRVLQLENVLKEKWNIQTL